MRQLYGLFEQDETGKWVRLHPEVAFTKATAVRVFQSALLAFALGTSARERRLKVVKA